jgi:hypothetical protein
MELGKNTAEESLALIKKLLNMQTHTGIPLMHAEKLNILLKQEDEVRHGERGEEKE